jgi:hypothetical protein
MLEICKDIPENSVGKGTAVAVTDAWKHFFAWLSYCSTPPNKASLRSSLFLRLNLSTPAGDLGNTSTILFGKVREACKLEARL